MPSPDNQSQQPAVAASNLPDLPPGYTLDGSPEPSAAFSTGISSQPKADAAEAPSTPPLPAGYKIDEQQPSAASRFAGAMTESSTGLPADIRKWPEAIGHLTDDPFTGKPSGGKGLTKGGSGGSLRPGGILNAPANIAKGIFTGSAAASQHGIDQFNQPGAINKAAGGLKYIIGGLPIVGPNIVKSMEAAENGDYAGMFGTLTGMGLQAAMANPEATATRLDTAGKYLFSKPRVQETILAGEAKEMLTAAEAAARAKGKAKFPESDATIPGPAVSNIASKAIADHIQGSPETPGPLKSMMADDSFKRVGAIERVGGGLQDIFARMASDDPVTMRDAHGYYTELGRYAERDLPGDVYKAVKQTRDDLGELIGDQYKSERDPVTGANLNKYPQWEDAKSYWSDLHKHWWDTDSPLYKAMNSHDPHETLQALLGPSGDSADRTAAYLRNYTNEGADPKIVKAASTLFKGMDQMRIRGLYQASGGLLLAMMLREFGVPTAANAATVATLLSSRLAKGYFNTRPSLTSLLSDEIKPSTWRSFPLKGGDTNIKGNQSPFSGGGGPVAQPPPSPPPATIAPPNVPSQLLHGTTLDNAMDIAKNGFKPNEEGYSYFTPHRDIAESYGSMHDKPYAIMYFNTEKGMPFERDPDPEQLLGPGAVRYKGALKPNNLSIEAYTSEGEPVDSWHSRVQSTEDLDNLVKRVSTIPSSSNLTPTESTFLSSIKGHPSIHPDLKADIEAATSPNLPRELSGSKPRYGYRDKLYELNFPDDTTKALYTVAQETKNKAHDAFMDHLQKVFPNQSQSAIVAMGHQVRDSIKEMAKNGDPEAGPLQVPKFNGLSSSPVDLSGISGISVDRLKGIMDIMKYQKMGYGEATKIYDSINQPKPREGNVKINRLP